MNFLEEITVLTVIQSEERCSSRIPVQLMRFWRLRTRPADEEELNHAGFPLRSKKQVCGFLALPVLCTQQK